MSRIVHIISAIAICAAIAGCGKPKGSGAAITSTVVERESGRVTMETLYGYSGANDKIAFAIFTNISENAVSSVAGSWRGQIVAEEGGKPVLVFQGSPEALEINGTRYNYSDGRVFLASYLKGELTVKQLDLPIKDADGKDEIARLSEQPEVQDFLKK
ncbi:MAG: hypothetical protein AAF591_07740 [Verrucomicrobiota bacterium]